MTGKILIADALATNRIVLKARLAAAFYRVVQAGSGKEALELTRRARPDLLLVSGNLPDMTAEALISALRPATGADAAAPPVVVLLPGDAGARRLRALGAGAADVVTRPFENGFLLARLRSILRQRLPDADLALPEGTADALGFADEPATFRHRQRVAVLADSKRRAQGLCARLSSASGHDIVALGRDTPRDMAALRRGADAIVLCIGADSGDTGLSLLAELRASPHTRHARTLVVLDSAAAHLAVPLLDMGASDAVPGPVDDRELALRLAAQLTRKRQDDALRYRVENGLQAAVIDPLTGLYNRRYALSFLKRILADAQRAGQTCAVMMADLDHFKSVNDGFGHAAGDTVLARISAQMRAGLPAETMIARIGGEEFLIAVPDTSAAKMQGLADRLCHTVRETPVVLAGGAGPVHVTVSIGVALATPKAHTIPIKAEALLARADRALYDSKSSGRDMVSFCRRRVA